MKKHLLACWLVLLLLLAACRAEAVQPEPARTAPVPTLTPWPSVTPPPTPAASPSPWPSPTPPPTPTPTAAPTATPFGRLGPDSLPGNVNPLTGFVVDDPGVLDRRPLAVKIVNQPPCSRPQYGLNQADVIFEHYVEAWGTRFTAIFHGAEAEKVGAVRSARLIDLELPAIFDALLATSGSSGGVRQRLEASDFAARVVSAEWGAGCPPLCRVPVDEVPCADTEHSMFTSTRDLHGYAAEAGLQARPRLSGWAFSDQPLAAGLPASRLAVGYLNAPVDWSYDLESGLYLRSQDGNRQVDAQTGLRLNAANVVVLFAHHLYSDIRESSNFYSLEVQFWGQGPALVFRDGQAYSGLWLRPERAGLFRLVDAAGLPIPLKPGRTWFEFVALDSPVTADGGAWTIRAAVLPEQTPPRPR